MEGILESLVEIIRILSKKGGSDKIVKIAAGSIVKLCDRYDEGWEWKVKVVHIIAGLSKIIDGELLRQYFAPLFFEMCHD